MNPSPATASFSNVEPCTPLPQGERDNCALHKPAHLRVTSALREQHDTRLKFPLPLAGEGSKTGFLSRFVAGEG